MVRIYRYIIVHDSGDAPCIENGIITLATCKPVVRRKAQPGDWVAGFMPTPHHGVLVYVGKVSGKHDWANYAYDFPRRRDACYRTFPDGSTERLRPEYHNSDSLIKKDISAPALSFDPNASWYFGDHPQQLPDHLMHIAPRGRGHRVNGSSEEDIERLEEWLRGNFQCGILGRPTHG